MSRDRKFGNNNFMQKLACFFESRHFLTDANFCERRRIYSDTDSSESNFIL